MVRALDLVHRRALVADRDGVLSRAANLGPATHAFLEELTGAPLGDEAPWIEALTHGSTGEGRDYQRLEFLGDRVLGLVVAEWLHAHSAAREGQLSQRLNVLVSGAVCASIARAQGVPAQLRLGKQARDDGGADSDNILGDVMEALIGAHFLTRGFEPTRAFVLRLWAEALTGGAGEAKHPKSALQEWAAGNRRKVPEYRLLRREGPDHALRFTVAVAVKGVGEIEAEGTSKQEAETAAAAAFIERFGGRHPRD